MSPPYAWAVALQDVREAVAPLAEGERVGVLLEALAGLGRARGNERLFLALVQEALRERLGMPGETAR